MRMRTAWTCEAEERAVQRAGARQGLSLTRRREMRRRREGLERVKRVRALSGRGVAASRGVLALGVGCSVEQTTRAEREEGEETERPPVRRTPGSEARAGGPRTLELTQVGVRRQRAQRRDANHCCACDLQLFTQARVGRAKFPVPRSALSSLQVPSPSTRPGTAHTHTHTHTERPVCSSHARATRLLRLCALALGVLRVEQAQAEDPALGVHLCLLALGLELARRLGEVLGLDPQCSRDLVCRVRRREGSAVQRRRGGGG